MYSGRNSESLPVFLHIGAYFSFYWLSQVLTNIVHVTISGVFATHYFTPGTKSPTSKSLKRACTRSFGTICFGALIYAIVQTVKSVLDFFKENRFLGCIYEACFYAINDFISFITPLVYCEVAIYGKPFVQAANDAFTIVKDRGLDIVLNDIIISTVWTIGAVFGALAGAVASQYYLLLTLGWSGTANTHSTSPEYKLHKWDVWVVTILIFSLGMQIMFTAGAVVHSGVATIFITLAEDPKALARTKPEFFAKMQAAYPDITEGVEQ
ncbi:putative choline transporter, neither null mutation nor overexpression affects choline transport [Gryganskiella cystojenkinii]|nr:putative choline transporter, neither null mutation nor overexpression affects choline transport [Gryganskiella cystojenkinii]